MKSVSNPQLSPDGRWVAYTVTRTNWDDNAYDTDIWMANYGNRRAVSTDALQKIEQQPRLVAGWEMAGVPVHPR